MGWNDHVEIIETECQNCGVTDAWEFWDDVALARYSGSLGLKLGHDASIAGKCPHCGSPNGKPVDYDEIGWDD